MDVDQTSLEPLVNWTGNYTANSSSPSDVLLYYWTHTGHYITALVLGLIGVVGFLGNLAVVVVFMKFSIMRTPTNMFLLSLAIGDMAVAMFGNPFASLSSWARTWLFGPFICQWYGFVNTLFGIVSIVTLAMVALDRYLVICHPTIGMKINMQVSLTMNAVAWIYALGWSVAPFLGWSRYQLEAAHTWCSLLWQSNDPSVFSYIFSLFIGVYVVPFLAMVYCYTRLFLTVRQVSRQAMGKGESKADEEKAEKAAKREQKIMLMTIIMCAAFLFAWTPYAVVALRATFGDPEDISIAEAVIPSLLAKSAIAYNPFIYIAFNEKFRKCLVKLLPFLSCVIKVPEEATVTATMSTTGGTVNTTMAGGNKVGPA